MEMAGLKGREARRRLSDMLAESGITLSVQAIGQVLTTPGRAFSAEISARVARLLRVDHYWLATGEGDAKPTGGLSEDAIAWARRYDRMDTESRAKFAAALTLAIPNVKTQAPEKPAVKRSPEKANH